MRSIICRIVQDLKKTGQTNRANIVKNNAREDLLMKTSERTEDDRNNKNAGEDLWMKMSERTEDEKMRRASIYSINN